MPVDYFLKLDGIDGESTAVGHKGEIDVLAFSWGVAQSGTPGGGGGGGGAGKAEFEDLLVVARTSKASPKLFLACASGQHIKSAVLSCRRGGTKKQEFLRLELTDVLVASYEIDGSEDELPLDQVGLRFAKVAVSYTPADKAGKAQPPVTAGWDLKKNAKV